MLLLISIYHYRQTVLRCIKPSTSLNQYSDDEVKKQWKQVLLTHWGRVKHICVSNLTIIGSDNGLSPGRRQAIIWISAGILLIWTVGTNFSEIQGKIHSFSFQKMHLNMSSAKGHLFSLGLNELNDLCHMYDRSQYGGHFNVFMQDCSTPISKSQEIMYS